MNWKLYAYAIGISTLLVVIGLQRLTILALERSVKVYQTDAASQEAANQLAMQAYKQALAKLVLTEQEAAKAQVESTKRTNAIMQEKITGGCEGAIQYGIEKAKTLFSSD